MSGQTQIYTQAQPNRKTRRKKAKAKRKAAKQAYKILRGGVGNALVALPVSNPQQPITSVP